MAVQQLVSHASGFTKPSFTPVTQVGRDFRRSHKDSFVPAFLPFAHRSNPMASIIALFASSWSRFLSTIVLLYIISALASWWRLRNFKGPWLGKFSYLYMARAELSKHANVYWLAASTKYGKLIRIGPNDLISSDAEIMRQINGGRSGFTKSNFYDVMKVTGSQSHYHKKTDLTLNDLA
jgi:hypothetical protein